MSATTDRPLPELDATLAFTRRGDVSPDAERAGLLRARTLPFDPDPHEFFDFETCTVHDCLAPASPPLDLEAMGFSTIELGGNARLQQVLATVRREDHVSHHSSAEIRRSLHRRSFRLPNGKRLRLLFIAPEGLIYRRAGPNGLRPDPDEQMDGANGHDGATTVHGDQDVYGTPLKQMMRGAAPFLFRHDTPDGRNRRSPIVLLNLWIPLQQITRPLTLMDRRSLDKRRHQLRYALPVTSFLERDHEQAQNDIWTFLHDPGQQWYIHSDMDSSHGYVFDTLGLPHGACVLPGEAALEALYRKLARACDAIACDDAGALEAAVKPDVGPLPLATTAPIRAAHHAMTNLLEEAQPRAAALCADGDDWTGRAKAAMDRVIRRSVEMRVVATLTPSWFPV